MLSFPKTTPEHYLTGRTALNIPCDAEGGGDWHFHEAFFGREKRASIFFIAGVGETPSTQAIFNDFGIVECSQTLKKMGIPLPDQVTVYTAGHYRAVLDLLYKTLLKEGDLSHLEIEAWFDTPEQIYELIEKAHLLYPHLNTHQQGLLTTWIQFNTKAQSI